MAADERQVSEKAALDASHQDPANWTWGIFYHNKADHRLLPPKRIPDLGYTVNFANWRSVLLLVLASLAIAGVIEGLVYLFGKRS